MLKALVNKINWKSRRLGGSPVHSVYIETLHFTPLSSILFFLKVSFTGSVCQGKSPWMRPEGASVCVVLCPLLYLPSLVAVRAGGLSRPELCAVLALSYPTISEDTLKMSFLLKSLLMTEQKLEIFVQ